MPRKFAIGLLSILLSLVIGCKALMKKSEIHIESGPRLPIGLYEGGYATDGKIIFSIGGSTFLGTLKQPIGEIYLYSPFTEEWQKARFSSKPVIKGPASSIFVPESNLIISTGFAEVLRNDSYAFPLEILDLNNYRIEYVRANPHLATQSSIVTYRGKVYIMGGISYAEDGSSGFSRRLLEFDPMTNEWRDLSPMPKARATYAVVTGQSLFAFGGYDEENTYAEVWRYDFDEDYWETASYLPYPVREFGLAAKYPYVYLATVGQEKNLIGRFDVRDGAYHHVQTALTTTSPGVAIVGEELFIFGGSWDGHKTASNKTFRIALSELMPKD